MTQIVAPPPPRTSPHLSRRAVWGLRFGSIVFALLLPANPPPPTVLDVLTNTLRLHSTAYSFFESGVLRKLGRDDLLASSPATGHRRLRAHALSHWQGVGTKLPETPLVSAP